MADRPILFSGPMVRALLAGQKTQTRRVLTPQPPHVVTGAGRYGESSAAGYWKDEWSWLSGDQTDIDAVEFEGDFKTSFLEGDRLYVREAWRTEDWLDNTAPRDMSPNVVLRYVADPVDADDLGLAGGKFRQGMHMPRWASRLTLIVTEVRVQRVQDIVFGDVIAEGIPKLHTPRGAGESANEHGVRDTLDNMLLYAELWDSLNAKRGFGWAVNPWVVAVSFDVHRGNIDSSGVCQEKLTDFSGSASDPQKSGAANG